MTIDVNVWNQDLGCSNMEPDSEGMTFKVQHDICIPFTKEELNILLNNWYLNCTNLDIGSNTLYNKLSKYYSSIQNKQEIQG